MIIDVILVPQGAEYQAVCRGLSDHHRASLPIIALPLGFNIVVAEKILTKIKHLNAKSIVIMGLCGGLSPKYHLGDVVIYQSCFDAYERITKPTDETLTTIIANYLGDISLVTSLTSDRVIHLASEKQQLYKCHNTDVVDMEGFGYLKLLETENIAVAMVRIVSDDSQHDIPDLNQVINQKGKLETLPLTLIMLKKPLAAIRLIFGSLIGLKQLEITSKNLMINSK